MVVDIVASSRPVAAGGPDFPEAIPWLSQGKYQGYLGTKSIIFQTDVILTSHTINLSEEAPRVLSLKLYRDDKVSLRRAAELSQTPLPAFMDFAPKPAALPLQYSHEDLEEERRSLNVSTRDGYRRFVHTGWPQAHFRPWVSPRANLRH